MSEKFDTAELSYKSHKQLAQACSEAIKEILSKSQKEDGINLPLTKSTICYTSENQTNVQEDAMDSLNENDVTKNGPFEPTIPQDDGIKILYQIHKSVGGDSYQSPSTHSLKNDDLSENVESNNILMQLEGSNQNEIKDSDLVVPLQLNNHVVDRRRNMRVVVNPTRYAFDQINPLYDDYYLRPLEIPIFGHLQEHFQVIMNYFYGQGDNQDIDNVGRLAIRDDIDRRDHIVVSVLFSPYTKFVAFILALNTIFLFKLAMWSSIQDYF